MKRNDTVFSTKIETEIANHVLKLSKFFHDLTSAELRKIAFQYGKMSVMKHNFNRNREEAGKDWCAIIS